MLACQRDSRLKRLAAEVTACEPAEGGFSVVLSDTVLYPEGGGQPADRGWIGGVEVVDVQRREGQVVHRALASVPLGPTTVEVDWARRFDHMQQHTGQHLLSAVAWDRYGAATTAFHLHPQEGGAVRRCDVELDAVLDDDRVADLEDAVDDAIRAALPVRVVEAGPSELKALGVRTRGVPEGLERVRLVEIAGVDLNTCGGTHLASTAQLGMLKLLGTERMRGGTRLFFVAGGRARALLEEHRQRADQLNKALSQGLTGWVDAVEGLREEARAARRAERTLGVELAVLLADALAAGSGVAVLHRSSGDVAFLNAIATAALKRSPELRLVLGAGTRAGAFLVAAPAAELSPRKGAILACLEARGGGPPGRLQGQAARLDRLEAVADLLRAG